MEGAWRGIRGKAPVGCMTLAHKYPRDPLVLKLNVPVPFGARSTSIYGCECDSKRLVRTRWFGLLHRFIRPRMNISRYLNFIRRSKEDKWLSEKKNIGAMFSVLCVHQVLSTYICLYSADLCLLLPVEGLDATPGVIVGRSFCSYCTVVQEQH